jgi:hypothetical protein
VKRRLIITCCLIAVITSISAVLLRSQLSAIYWHLTHGIDMSWNDHKITVPWLWQPISEPNNGTMTIAHAETIGASSELRILRTGATLESSRVASKWQQDGISLMNSKALQAARYQSYAVVTSGGDAFCIASGEGEEAVSFDCRVVGTDLEFRFLGWERNLQDARAMVSSLR